MNGLTFIKMELPAVDDHGLGPPTDEVHFHAPGLAIVKGLVTETAGIHLGVQIPLQSV